MFDFLDSKNIGKEYKNFVLLSIDDLPDYKTKGVYLRHKTTGLEVYHIIADDKENTFSFGFRTLAKNSKGCAHIMEHSTLCGSEKYPLKEPFNTLAGQSLNTFLNAITYPDKTVYPAASLVRSDYFTMMDVYADAVFFPKLDYETFIQEGHRLEIDDKQQLSIQGVVYNEMKGNYSAFIDVAIDEQIRVMYPDSFPAFDSGGDPLEIPTLTYEEFLEFHQKFYNPDNCLLYLYGNIPTKDQLDYFSEHFIPRLEKKYNCNSVIENVNNPLPLIKPEIKQLQKLNLITESTEVKTIAPETGATGSVVCMNWYSGENNIEKLYLAEVLCGNDSSPLSKRLKKSKLGDDLSPIWGNFGQMKEEFFSYGLSGVKKGNEEKVYALVQNSIDKIYKKKEITQTDIDSAVMGIDFSLREVTRYYGPYSLVLMDKVLKGWNYGKSCKTHLFPISSFEKLKIQLKEDKEFTNKLIKKYFIDNKVCVKLIVEPSPEYFQQRKESEANLIKQLEINLDKEKLKQDLDKLHKYQQHIETPQETACIPHTKISELDRKFNFTNPELQFIKGNNDANIPLFVSKEPTNGIFYIDVLFPFDRLEPQYFQHIPTVTNIITNMGWNNKKWDECTAQTACIMGDVWGRTLCGQVPDCDESREFLEQFKQYNFADRNWIGLTCKALTSRAEETLELLAEIISKMSFDDVKRFETLLQEIKADRKASIIQMGRELALRRATATLSKSLALKEIMWGASQYETTKNYKKKNIPQLLEMFKKIYQDCLSAGGIIHLAADEESLEKIIPLLQKFAEQAELKELKPKIDYSLDEYLVYVVKNQNIRNPKSKEVIRVETQTGYSIMLTSCSKFMTKKASSENVYTSWLSMHSLWDKIRTTGGAYGAGAWLDSSYGFMGMYSYRDPNPAQSIQIYLNTLKEMAQSDFDEEDIEKTIVSLYGGVITPVSPSSDGNRGFEGLLYGNPKTFMDKKVEMLLSVTKEDIKTAAQNLYENSKTMCKEEVFCDKSIDYCGKNLILPL